METLKNCHVPNGTKAQELSNSKHLNVCFEPGTSPLYISATNEVRLPFNLIASDRSKECAIIFHELGHAWQQKNCAVVLNWLWWFVPIRLLIEWHASYLALQWMKEYNYPLEDFQEAKKLLYSGLKLKYL